MKRLILLQLSVLLLMGGCIEDSPITRSHPPALEGNIVITRFWSEQFSAHLGFNQLPDGAGCTGSAMKRILMGTRSDSRAYAGASVDVADPQLLEYARVRFCRDMDEGLVLHGEGAMDGSVASVSMLTEQSEAVPTEYLLAAWIDYNENDAIDADEPVAVSNGCFAIVNTATYLDVLNELSGLAFLAFPVPRARAFFRAFLRGGAIEYGGTHTSSPIQFIEIEDDLQNSLSYNVGVDLATPTLATVRNFFFGPQSDLAYDIVNADAFQDTLLAVFHDNADFVTSSYPGTSFFEFALPAHIEFPLDADLGSVDGDLSRVFHTALLSGHVAVVVVCENGMLVPRSVDVAGTLLDLYDFNYDNVEPLQYGHKAALVQAGYGTIGDGGGVFRTEVEFDAAVLSVHYEFGPCSMCEDRDSDGYYAQSNCGSDVDCDDDDPTVHPRANDVCEDGVDQDCNGSDAACDDPVSMGMVLIPAGEFLMGDALNDSVGIDERELPVHTVYVDAFYIDRYEVTTALWESVKTWAVENGYELPDYAGAGKAPDHPVQQVNWYDCIIWCNARSEKEGRTPCYYTTYGSVYKKAILSPVVHWDANGYRLPTEAEWEKAARGGVTGQRFPWGDTINHDHANYRADGSWPYDTSPFSSALPGEEVYHPAFTSGEMPYTSPVGYFAPNGYGLYDVVGNVWEWCYDGYDGEFYGSSPYKNPRPDAVHAMHRVMRGGSWGADNAPPYRCRVSFRQDRMDGARVCRSGLRVVLCAR